jgi:hypothetical protein
MSIMTILLILVSFFVLFSMIRLFPGLVWRTLLVAMALPSGLYFWLYIITPANAAYSLNSGIAGFSLIIFLLSIGALIRSIRLQLKAQ